MKSIGLTCLLLIFFMLYRFSSANPSRLEISINPAYWNKQDFKGSTDYTPGLDNGVPVLTASAKQTSSALYREIHVDLEATPKLHWSWRIDKAGYAGSDDIDERSKAGDDFPARIYVIRRGGLAFWKTRAITYVWSRSQPEDSRWRNPYAERSQVMWVVESGWQGEWSNYSRDIRADWRLAFAEEISSLSGIALMTDADNTAGIAKAVYKNLFFSAE